MLHRQSDEGLYVVDPKPPKPEWLQTLEAPDNEPPAQPKELADLHDGDEIRMLPLVTRETSAEPGGFTTEEFTNGNPWGGGGRGGGGGGGGGFGGIAVGAAAGALGHGVYNAGAGAFKWLKHHL